LRELCDEHGILLIVDEIQSGFGRTGRWFAFEHFDLRPDIITVAKGVASGLPLSGVFSRLDLMEKWIPGSHGGTFGGNVVAAAAAVATIQAIRDEQMLVNAQERGEQIMVGLRSLQEEFSEIGDVRGLGLMVAAEFRSEGNKPDKYTAKAIVQACQEESLLLMTCGPWDNTIRWIPPLVVTEKQINQALGVFTGALEKVLVKN
ncbi:MAG: aminotransferase class III-fold pyridoxal phosphate-dependent enzyme, partial [Anaerolineales bacterium]|nr:aminotransferase class III-fold pyridoxal phosphate-dependent enzyme [Anaerolineales bacterium]